MNCLVNAACCLGLAIGLVVACGGATTDSTPPFSSGLPPNQGLSDLSAADGLHLCDRVLAYVRSDPGDGICRLQGVASASIDVAFSDTGKTDADLRRECAEAQQKCDMGIGTKKCEMPKLGADCTGTVSEYEACVSEEIATLDRALSRFPSCSSLTRADLESSSTTGLPKIDLLVGPSCERLKQHCPEAFGSMSSSTTVTVTGPDAGPAASRTGWVDAGPLPTCGNGVIEDGEQCDSTEVPTCVAATMAAFPHGSVRCVNCLLDLSGCTS